MCCKEIGHTIENCPRDPNIKTKVEPELDYERIQRIKDYRKLFADTAVLTTHMLKKCVLIPYKMSNKEEDAYQQHPFKRGAMKFDDFNYHIYNPYILIEDTNNTGPQTRQNIQKMADVNGPILSHGALEQQTLDAYQFGTISLGKSEYEQQLEEEEKKMQAFANELAANKTEEEKKDQIASEKARAKELDSIGEGTQEPFEEQSPVTVMKQEGEAKSQKTEQEQDNEHESEAQMDFEDDMEDEI